jgi:hypothetical protein
MIRTRARIGIVQSGQGGNASDYSFDPSTGLSNDPQLAYYLQDLTPQQLQVALTPDPTGDMQYQTTLASHNAYVTSGLDCDGTTCGANIPANTFSLPSVPTWVWIAGAAVAGVALLGGRR